MSEKISSNGSAFSLIQNADSFSFKIKMASGGLMCEVSTVPKIGPKIESMEFLASLGKFILNLKVSKIF